MKSPNYKVKIGIVGCGAIGSGIAKGITKDFYKDAKVAALFDIDQSKALRLEKDLQLKHVVAHSLDSLIKKSDCIVEAVNAEVTETILRKSLEAKKSVLAMSVGKILGAEYLFKLAQKNKCFILLPSGAIAGLDAIKAASLANIKKITLTTRKAPRGFRDNIYLHQKGFDLGSIEKETVLFDGKVKDAVKYFPQNINVAATLAFASQTLDKLRVRIITSPKYTKNIHEVEVEGDFGRITTKTENEVCPDNPKTSYLAVLSGLQTLKQFCTGILIGT